MLILSGLVLASPIRAQDTDSGLDADSTAEVELSLTEDDIDGLFARLAASEDEKEAKAVEFEIIKRFHRSGSDTVDLLMSWANTAMEDENLPLALDVLDQVTILRPQYAEGWNKRATVHYMKGDFGKSIADIEKTLAIEPRHFGALAGLGLILREIGETGRALKAFQEALKVHPYLGNATDMVKTLKNESGDRDI